MTKKIVYADEDRRIEVESPLMRESLINETLRAGTESALARGVMPGLDIISLGGHSIIDRGAKALMPLVDVIVAARAKHKILIGAGGGARVRHTLHIGLSLGLPVGALANLVSNVDAQNATLLTAVLAKHRGVLVAKEEFLKIPLLLETGMIPIMSAMPPYHFWEPAVGDRKVPLHAHDLGMFVIAEVTGARSLIYVKDEDGLFTDDPKTNPAATHIPRISARAVLDRELPDLPLERVVLKALVNARQCRSLRIINGLVPDQLRRALAGDEVGTLITAED